jgi:hypothetical protein
MPGFSGSLNRNCNITLMLASLLAFALHLRAQSVLDLSGIWDSSQPRDSSATESTAIGLGDIPFTGFTNDEPPMRPEAAERYKRARAGVVRPWDKGSESVDPVASCFPYGPTRGYTVPRPWEIRQSANITLILFERGHGVRRVFTDGRGHPEGYLVTWMGHSIGKYESDSLVVDTVSMHARTWLDNLGHPHSDVLHLTERFRRMDPDTLQIELTFDDVKTYTRPWNGQKIFKRAPTGTTILDDSVCEEWLEIRERRLY